MLYPLPCDAALLSAYHDDALEDQQRQQVTAHLRACPACRQELAVFERLARALRELPVAAAPPRLPTNVAALAGWRRERAR